jgi:hypothetical protein
MTGVRLRYGPYYYTGTFATAYTTHLSIWLRYRSSSPGVATCKWWYMTPPYTILMADGSWLPRQGPNDFIPIEPPPGAPPSIPN